MAKIIQIAVATWLIPLSQVPATAGPGADLKALEEGLHPLATGDANHAFGLLDGTAQRWDEGADTEAMISQAEPT